MIPPIIMTMASDDLNRLRADTEVLAQVADANVAECRIKSPMFDLPWRSRLAY